METLKSFFTPETQRGREVRTWIQAMLGLSTWLSAMALSPEFRQFFEAIGLTAQVGVVSAIIAAFSRIMHVIAAVYNKLSGLFKEIE